MSPVEVLLLLALAAFFAGLGGSYLGIGGGVFLVPFMTLVLAVDIKRAIATSLIGVIATSSGAASVYVRDHLTNLDRKSTRLNSSHRCISYAVFCLKKKKKHEPNQSAIKNLQERQ